MTSLKDITQRLVASYRAGGGINHIGGRSLPSRAAVAAIALEIEELIFPGFIKDEALNDDNVELVTGVRVFRLAEMIEEQAALDLAFQLSKAVDDVRDDAAQFAIDFLGAVPALRAELALDVQALLDGDPAARAPEEIILAYPGMRAVLVHRVAHVFWQRGIKLLARMLSEDVHGRTGIDIHPGANIGKSFYIDHGTGVVVGETTDIGDHVKLYQGVTLGAHSVVAGEHTRGRQRHPTIEDGVTIYAGATILGGDTIVGHHSVVGGNVWLVESVPPFSLVEHQAVVRVGSKAPREMSGFDPGI